MNRWISKFLKQYDRQDQELLLKAKFLLSIKMIVISVLIVTIIYTSYTFGIGSLTVLTQFVALGVMLTAMTLLIRGNYVAGVHILFCTVFLVVWFIMFNEPVSSLVIKLDTIVFIIGMMSALPLMFFNTGKPMVVYFVGNLAIFVGYNYYLVKVADMTVREHIDYALDNTIAMVFVFLVSYILFTIYRRVLTSLRQYRKLLSGMINSMPSMIIGVDKSYDIIMWNKEASRLTGITMENGTGRKLFNILPQLEPFKSELEKVMESDAAQTVHKETVIFQGENHVIDAAFYPLSHDEQGGAVIRIDDISERLHMEEVIAQSEKMLSIGGLAAGMAHELNNPLSGMIQSAQVVRNRLTQNLEANVQAAEELNVGLGKIKGYMKKRKILSQIDNIVDAGTRAAKIIQNMLSFAGKSGTDLEECNVFEIMENTIELARNDYDLQKKQDFKDIRIVRNYDPQNPLMIQCRESKIQQVLFNILKNASEAFQEVRTQDYDGFSPEITIDIYSKEKKIYLEIADNGPGMDDATKKRIFEPFFTTKPVDQGTGLGLSVSYFIIVEDHDGELKVESAPGKGTKFIIRLPE